MANREEKACKAKCTIMMIANTVTAVSLNLVKKIKLFYYNLPIFDNILLDLFVYATLSFGVSFPAGKIRSVRRSLFPQSSTLVNGVLWEWANDEGGWTAYEMHTSGLLEQSYLSRHTTADLGPHGHNYVVDFTSLEQVNKSSGFRRRVHRQVSTPYPIAAASGMGSVIHSGPACTCQQCLSHGPMPGRSRHSFSAAAGPSSAYSPYPRRPLSVGNMAWGGPWSPAATSMAQPPGPVQSFTATPNGLR